MAHSVVPRSLLAAGSLLLLTACGNGGEQDDGGTAGSTGTTSEAPASSPAETGSATAQETGADGPVPAGYPPRPARDECVVIPEAADGAYTVYEAGTAVVTREGDRLVLGEVSAADGWTSRVDDQDDDEIEIDFRRNGSDALDLEVELDDGRKEVKICADDD
ncbi:hypothetical protein [Blastococcus sp. PRF04-17]|uniref:hypothetical protein n=1 Tax=Blastococcus sp. PRF04-17 TaxID=2933797 RepID=UPI001FF5288B|nr:hypothetical protein [Blastococcus sp. PRF04-17]UOY02585.1 hypothetical protein MVA48_04215 [Blastococcus sp. PRF04-17]